MSLIIQQPRWPTLQSKPCSGNAFSYKPLSTVDVQQVAAIGTGTLTNYLTSPNTESRMLNVDMLS